MGDRDMDGGIFEGPCNCTPGHNIWGKIRNTSNRAPIINSPISPRWVGEVGHTTDRCISVRWSQENQKTYRSGMYSWVKDTKDCNTGLLRQAESSARG